MEKKFTKADNNMQNDKTDQFSFLRKPGFWISLLVVVLLSTILFFQSRINQLVTPQADQQGDSGQTTSESFKLPQSPEYILKKIPDKPKVAEQPTTVTPQIMDKPVDPEVADEPTGQSTAPEQVTIINEDEPVNTTSNTENEKQDISKPATDNPTAKPTSTAKLKLTQSLASSQIHDQSWILSQPATYMTAQMMASSRPEALLRTARNPALKGQSAIFHIMRNNKDWYVLIYGSYASRAGLQQAVNKLPDSLKKGKPWIRPMSAIQSEIRSGKK